MVLRAEERDPVPARLDGATGKTPAGPFTDTSAKPLVCQADEGGSIDPSPRVAADGTVYLYWQNDGNCCGLPVKLYG